MPTENPNLDSVRDIRKGPKKQLIDTFNQTNLDTQDNAPEGGPNRTNAYNRLGTVGSDGTYTLQNASTSPLSPTPGGVPLKNREKQDVTQSLNAYTPSNTYMESIIKYRDEANNKLI